MESNIEITQCDHNHLTDHGVVEKITVNKKVEITLQDYHYQCGDGCCDEYGTKTYVNGALMDLNNSDVGTILGQVLEHLGFDATVNHEYDED